MCEEVTIEIETSEITAPPCNTEYTCKPHAGSIDAETQCCFSVKALRSVEVQTEESSFKTKKSSQELINDYPHPEAPTHLLDHNYYADHLHCIESKPETAPENVQQLDQPSTSSTYKNELNEGTDENELDVATCSTSEDYHPDCSSDSEQENDVASPLQTRNFMVNEDRLDELFNLCCTCGLAIIEKKKIVKGSMLSVEAVCIQGHVNKWDSQPSINGMPIGNLLISAAILFSGNTFTPINHFATCLNLQLVSKSSFYKIQEKYVFPVVQNSWHDHQQQLLQQIRDRRSPINVCGDGRCDSPGHSAKYGTYTLLDETSGKVVDFSLVQVTEVSSSNAMEYEGCKRSLNKLLGQRIPVRCLTTDRHVTITARMKSEYPNIKHQYDVWHLAKSVTKKLTKKAKKKCNEALTPWIQSISNHLWWSVGTCDGNPEVLKEKWVSIVNHAANKHSWKDSKQFTKCMHHKLKKREKKLVPWLEPGSPAHIALEEVVTQKRLLKDIEKLTEFHHTGSLEVFHSLMLKYLPKRKHFSYTGMVARTQLPALDHNHNCSRPQAVIKSGANKGQLRFKVEKPKAHKSWVCKPIKEKKSYQHVSVMLENVVKAKQTGITAIEELPDMPQNIVREPRPPKQSVIARHRSRMSK